MAMTADLRGFLLQHRVLDLVAVSSRLCVLDARLPLRKALAALLQSGSASAPILDSLNRTYAGMLSMTDLVRLWNYILEHPQEHMPDLNQFSIAQLKQRSSIVLDPTMSSSASSPPCVAPDMSLWDLAHYFLDKKLRRVAVLKWDTAGLCSTADIIAVVTQYRLVKFIAVNVCSRLRVDRIHIVIVYTSLYFFTDIDGCC